MRSYWTSLVVRCYLVVFLLMPSVKLVKYGTEAKVATVGRWKAGPREAFLLLSSKTLEKSNIIAEDLVYLKNKTVKGIITADVIQLRKAVGAPGMAVVQFGDFSQLVGLW